MISEKAVEAAAKVIWDDFVGRRSGADYEGADDRLAVKQQVRATARAVLEAVHSLHDDPNGWQPIETAPQDEVLHMGWWKTWPPGWPDPPQWNQEIGTYWCTRGGWRHGQATHWRPLAAPPVHVAEKDGDK